MKVITIEELVAHIRPLRTGKTFLCNFINDCEIIDVVSMETIDKMVAEIGNCSETYPAGWSKRTSKTAKEMKQDILEIIHKHCKEK